MSISQSGNMTAADYDRAAMEYLRTLPLEHFMESTPQATQREIALESLAILKTRRPELRYFSELLVQYRFGGKFRRVVPDNMLVLCEELEETRRSNYALELEPAEPFMMLEWVSDSSEGKDYDESFGKYERELRTPYCLSFHPDKQDLRVYRHDGQSYVRLEPDITGRIEIPELDLQIGLLDGWVRFWHRGELLPLPAELEEQMQRMRQQLAEKDRELGEKDRRIASLEEQHEQMLASLRGTVEARARSAGRDDILQQLATTSDVQQLWAWLGELS